MANMRGTRLNETRESDTRKISWKPAHDLPVPEPQDGYGFRWIRVATMGNPDPGNMARAKREKWVPCKAADHPEMTHDFGAHGVDANGNIEIGGLILCKIPIEYAQARDEYYQAQGQAQMDSVDNNFMRQEDPRMPLYAKRESKTTFGKGF